MQCPAGNSGSLEHEMDDWCDGEAVPERVWLAGWLADWQSWQPALTDRLIN